MGKWLMAGLVCWWCLGATAYADQSVYAQVQNQDPWFATDDYEAVPLTWTDAGALVAIAGSFYWAATAESPLLIQALPAVAVLGWGIWRTEQYRPQEVKDRIRAKLAERTTTSHPGGYPGF